MQPGEILHLTFHNTFIVPLVRSHHLPRIFLVFRHHFRIIESSDSQNGSWQANVAGYMYTLQDRDGREIVSYHWHPDQQSPVTYSHLHIGVAAVGEGASVSRRDIPGIHFPTRFIAVQDIIRLAITQFDVHPLWSDWEQILRDTDSATTLK